MKTVKDVRLNAYSGQIVWRSPIMNEYEDRYGWYVSNQPHEGATQVIIGYDDHDPECSCDLCCGIEDAYNRLVIAEDMRPVRSFYW